jgi:two-component system, LuxR family, sensor kinase FixL
MWIGRYLLTQETSLMFKTLLAGCKDQFRDNLIPVLAERGHDITKAADYKEAYRLFNAVKPDIVVLVCLNGRTRRFCKMIRESEFGDDVAILAVVKPEETELLNQLIDAGLDDFILESLTDPTRLNIRVSYSEKLIIQYRRRRKANDELEERIAHQQVIAELAQNSIDDPQPVQRFPEIAHRIRNVLDMDYCLILEKVEEKPKLLLHSCDGTSICMYRDGDECYWPYDEKLNDVLKTKEPVIVTDYSNQKKYKRPVFPGNPVIQTGAAFPVFIQDGTYGILAVYSKKKKMISGYELLFLKTAASVLSGTLRRDQYETALKFSETRSRAILNTTVDGIITIDKAGRIESYNNAAEKLFGYTFKEVVGKNVNMLMPEPYHSEHDGYMRHHHETGERRIIGKGREVKGLRKNGEIFPLYLAVSEVKLDNTTMYTGIVRDISEERRLELEIMRISDYERRSIGQDLHDGLGQMLTGIGLMSQNLARKLEKSDKISSDLAYEITGLIREADQYARGLSRGLVPVQFDEKGLPNSIQRLVKNAERIFGIRCMYREHNPPVFEDSVTVEHLYRITQEAISNAVKHGKADSVRITLVGSDDQMRLRIVDNGAGLAPDWNADGTEGIGVKIMNYRARLIGANLDISNNFKQGVVVTCTLSSTTGAYTIPEKSGKEETPVE